MKAAVYGMLITCIAGCASFSQSLGTEGSRPGGGAARIAVIYYAPAWGPGANGEEVVYFLKQVTMETATDEQDRIYFCSTKPDGSERKEIAQLWKDHPDQFFENYSTAAFLDINAKTKQAALGVEQAQRGGLFIFNLDGTGFRSVWPKEWNADRPTKAGYPTWSPDGKWIAFHEYRFEKGFNYYRIVKMHPDATDYTPLTERNAENGQPAWSPKWELIAYVNFNVGKFQDPHLFLMKPDGSEKRDTSAWGHEPRWSPDGSFVLHDSAKVVDPVSGKQVRRFKPDLPMWPKWGKSKFVSVGPDGIHTTELDGTGTQRLLTNAHGRGDIEKEAFRW
jgi:WD40-like Beta Propeller Repeat